MLYETFITLFRKYYHFYVSSSLWVTQLCHDLHQSKAHLENGPSWLLEPSLRVALHHGPWSRTMKDCLFIWSNIMVQFPWSNFLKKSICKAFEPLTRYKPNVDQGEWSCTQKWMCWFSNICPKMAFLRNTHVWPFFYLLLSSSSLPQKKFITFKLWQYFCAIIPCPFLP